MMISYDFSIDEWGNETETFEYEVERKDIEKQLQILVKEDYDDVDIDDFIERHFEELCNDYEEEIKNHFYDEAYEEYKEEKEFQKDPNKFYGVSRND